MLYGVWQRQYLSKTFLYKLPSVLFVSCCYSFFFGLVAFLVNLLLIVSNVITDGEALCNFWNMVYKQRFLISKIFCHCKYKCQIRAARIGLYFLNEISCLFHIWYIVIRLQFPWFPNCLLQNIQSKMQDENNQQAAQCPIEYTLSCLVKRE